MKKLSRDFYLQDTLSVSKNLLGKNLVHIVNGKPRIGKIVETEAYIGSMDKACHAYNYKKTPRTETIFNIGGTSYVYLIYGMYHCMNVVSEKVNEPCAILIRALEPLTGLDDMAFDRYGVLYENLTKKQVLNLSNGPGKLCIAMGINKEQNAKDLLSEDFYITENEDISIENIVISKRINIDYAEEAKDFPWRFYIKDNKFISKK
ncbi:DNA-3-methyladenine glycosylase [Clostridium cylindrosporum]|uniref:Putative 3-methyladenine DNA glycosylase n=1 Tax=Clostridium cylindrosporum DSM 605 TaxID=1121307 RepID=A0A0J8DE02_CLOCY|nr:DNA-3-methyladenine glycosylase [Clostridium cylindrosporum]KMT22454.1 putative 3-methyladenine DNA glycosylase [Clostridium cylindrosporum DSM 605]